MPASTVIKSALISFVIFCATSASASAHWEYLVKTYPLLGNDQALSQAMNKEGVQRWELVNCSKDKGKLTCIFKRPAKD